MTTRCLRTSWWLSFIFLSHIASSVAAENSNYRYDVNVLVPECARGALPKVQVLVEPKPYGRDFKLVPRASVEGEPVPGCPFALPGAELKISNHQDVWSDTFRLEAHEVGRIDAAKDVNVGWRAVVIDQEGQKLDLDTVEIGFLGAEPRSARGPDEIQIRVLGRFDSDQFTVSAQGYRQVGIHWQLDPFRETRPAKYMLVFELERVSGTDRSPSSQDSRASRPQNLVDPPEGKPSASTPESARPAVATVEPERLRILEFQLTPRDRSRWWPETTFWFRDAKAEDWRQYRLKPRQRPLDQPVALSLPDDLVGREVVVQVTTVDGEGLASLIFEVEQKEFPRIKIPGVGQARSRIVVRYPKPPQPVLEVRVFDPDGSPLPRAWVVADVRRNREIVQTSGAEADDQGFARIPVLSPSRDGIEVFCFALGWFGSEWVGYGSALQVDCRMEKLTSPLVDDDEAAPLLKARTIDRATGRPVQDARVEVEWKGRKGAVPAVSHGSGLWVLPTPNPPPKQAEVSVEAPCYGPITQEFEEPFEGVLRLEKQCLTAKLSLRLVEAGTGAPVRGADQAKVVVRQGSEPGREVQFQADGYSQPAEIDFDPGSGPVMVEVDLAGFARTEHQIENFEQRVNRSTGYTEDIEIPLARGGRGLAVLINAAENWPAFPQARRALIQALREADLSTTHNRLVVGTIGSQLRLFQAGESPALVDLSDPSALNEAQSWLGGASASGGLFHASQLTPDRLRDLDRVWAAAGSWDLVLVVPNRGAAETWETSEDLSGLQARLRKGKVRLFVVEDGGVDPLLHDLVGELEGMHYPIKSDVDSDERLKKLKKYVSKILRDPETGGDS